MGITTLGQNLVPLTLLGMRRGKEKKASKRRAEQADVTIKKRRAELLLGLEKEKRKRRLLLQTSGVSEFQPGEQTTGRKTLLGQ